LTALEGKVLRVNRDGSIPADNPFVNAAPARPEVYAYGFRNAWRLAIDPLTGKLWGVDVGDFTMEEVNRVKPGGNYSWPHAEGNLPQGGIPEGEIAPALAYPHGHGPTSYGSACTALGIAPAGFGELAGQLFFGDLGTNLVYRAPLDAQREGLAGTPVPFLVSAAAPVDIVFGPAGPATVQKALYYVAINAGEVRRVTAPIVYSDQGLPGTKLVLRVKPKQTAVLLSKGAVSAGGEEGDPLTFGATLRLTGAGFDTTLSLPAARWKAIGPKGGPPKVYRYLDPKSEAGPVRNLTIVQGTSLHLTAAGEALGLDLTQDPGVVSVELTIGALRKRLEFGGTVKYIAGKSLVATKAPPPRD
jgi:hypothetical protein